MTVWRFIDTGPGTASFNMAVDEAVANSVRDGKQPPTLRIYGWERPSVSIGLFQKTSDIDLQYCIAHGIDLVRRPTGGRAILHNDELTYGFSSRTEGFFSCTLMDCYRQLGLAFKGAFEKAGLQVCIKNEREAGRALMRSPLCFKTTSYGEIVFQGRKLIGSAQKRWKNGFLQQGSIPYAIDEKAIERIFYAGAVNDQKGGMAGLSELVPALAPDSFKEAVRLSFEEVFNVRFIRSSLSQDEFLLAHEFQAQRYLSREWNFQR